MSEQKDQWEWVGENYYINMTKMREEIKRRELPEAERGTLASAVACPCLTAAGPCDEHRFLLMPGGVNHYIFGDGDGSHYERGFRFDDDAEALPHTQEEE